MNRFGKRVVLYVSIAALVAGGEALAFGNMPGGGAEGAKAPASSEPIKVEKATGKDAYTVSELYEKSGTLDKKGITVRGKIVKVSKGIMGKNWIHLQDGTGDSGKGTHDLVVTTAMDAAAVGDAVTVKGTIYKDKDFGSGYKYAVIMEEATIQH